MAIPFVLLVFPCFSAYYDNAATPMKPILFLPRYATAHTARCDTSDGNNGDNDPIGPAGIFPKVGNTPWTDKNGLCYGASRFERNFLRFLRRFRVYFRVIDMSADGTNENLGCFARKQHVTSSFSNSTGGATAPGCQCY